MTKEELEAKVAKLELQLHNIQYVTGVLDVTLSPSNEVVVVLNGSYNFSFDFAEVVCSNIFPFDDVEMERLKLYYVKGG